MMQSNMPDMSGAGAMTDTLEFVKKLWGGLSVPGMVAPTVSTDELDKKISDLKTVETWLTMNMNMLRGSIQALEVQRATIATLKSMGDAFSAAAQSGTPEAKGKTAFDAAAFWSSLMTAPATPVPAVVAQEPVASAPESKPVAEPVPAPAPAKSAADKPDARTDMVGQMVNPATWWNVVQDQFKQAVSTAVASEKVAKTATAAPAPKPPRAAAKPAAKPAAVKPKAAPRKRPAAK
jgi:hypothetical protein